MTNGAYSFIDIAVLDGVRHHFAAGDPLVLLSSDLRILLWTNGPGARLLGYSDIESALGRPYEPGTNVRRQIAATHGFPTIGARRPLTIRLNSGLQSKPLNCMAGSVTLPDGSIGILLCVPDSAPPGLDNSSIARRAISGIDAPGHCAALIDADAELIAVSSRFADLDIPRETIAGLLQSAANESDRLIKRMLSIADSDVAIGVGRLTDDPELYLLVAVNEAANAKPTAGAPRREEPAPPAADAPPPEPAKPIADPVQTVAGGNDDEPAADRGFAAAEAAPDAVRERPEPVEPSQSGLDAVRFVWRTDAAGRFSALSEEFAAAIGPAMSDVIGRQFSEVAEALGFDSDGDIAGLLDRRDTWSGRSVLWPMGSTGKRVPVDLAALPAYGRDRTFEGFRGFGVVRLGEAIDDPASAQLSLHNNPADMSDDDKADPEGQPEAVDAELDPFMGEKPAIQMAPTPERRDTDKVVRLAAHRQKAAGYTLSEQEESAFREIGERLTDPDNVDGDSVPDRVERVAEDDSAATRPDEINEDRLDDGPSAPNIATDGFRPSAFATPKWPPRGGCDMSILEQLPVAVLIRSGDRLHYANPEFFRLTGYRSIAELDRAGGFDVLFAGPDGLTDEDDSSVRPAMRLVTREGAEKLCEAFLRSVRWDDHRALMLAVRPAPVFSPPMDGTDEIGEDLNDRIQELTAILDTATDGVVLVTPSGSIRSLNRSAEALFGFDSNELLGKQFTVLFAVESQRAAADYLSGLSENGVASVLNDGREVIGREAQGRFIPLFMTMGRLPGDRGYCAVMRDITPWKRAEEELTQARGQAEQASSLKTDFLARISHEVRTPLNAIIGFSELMMDEKFGPIGNQRYQDYLHDINRSGNHVLDLVNDLLDISKIEAGEQELEFESVSLNDALADVVAIMQPEANRERVIIRSSFASNLPEVVADLRSVKQIALNLLSNAIRFTPAGGQVIISTIYESSGNVTVRVRDTGIGMSRLEVEQAMKPFKQVSSAKAKRGDGTGLGLPLTKAMVEANRAGFSIDSKPDEGTIVEITFPSTRVLAD